MTQLRYSAVDVGDAPPGVWIQATASGEEVCLDRVSPLREPSFEMGCLALTAIMGSMCASALAARWGTGVVAVLGALGAIGLAPAAAMWALNRLVTPRSPVIGISPIECRLGRRQVRWGDVHGVELGDASVRFRLDGGGTIDFPLPYQPRERVAFVHAHLSRRLEQLAPGGPAEVPAGLRHLASTEEAPDPPRAR